MNDKDEILAAIVGLGNRLEARMDIMANGIGRIEADVATVKRDVLQLRVDVAAYRMESNARISTLEGKLG